MDDEWQSEAGLRSQPMVLTKGTTQYVLTRRLPICVGKAAFDMCLRGDSPQDLTKVFLLCHRNVMSRRYSVFCKYCGVQIQEKSAAKDSA